MRDKIPVNKEPKPDSNIGSLASDGIRNRESEPGYPTGIFKTCPMLSILLLSPFKFLMASTVVL